MVEPTKDPQGAESSSSALLQYSLASEDYIDQFIPFLRSELRSKQSLDGLITSLEETSQEKQTSLEGLSFDSVGDVTHSVDKIGSIVKDSMQLAKDLADVNARLKKTGSVYVEQKRKALYYKKLYSKITETSVTINTCLEMLEKTNTILELLQAKQFYKALVNLESLARLDFEELQQFDFSVRIYKSIPTFRRMITEETFNQLIKWMNLNLEKNFEHMGEVLFTRYNELNESWTAKQKEQAGNDLTSFKVNSAIERGLRDGKFRHFNVLSNSEVKVDLDPLFHAILVFESVNELEKLKDDYNNEILRRRDRQIYPVKEAMESDGMELVSSVDSLQIMLYSIAAFFVSDRCIAEETRYKLRSRKQTEDTFDSIVTKLVPLLEKYVTKAVDSVDKALQLSSVLGVFVQIVEGYGFNSSRLYEVMLALFKVYLKLLLEQFNEAYMNLSLDDESQPLTVKSERQLTSVQQNCFFLFDDGKREFPKTLPYSLVYPGSCLKMREFIRNIYEFLELYYDKRLDSVAKLVSGAVDEALIKVVLKDLSNKVNSTYKEEMSQNMINLDFFAKSVPEIEKYLNFSNEAVLVKSRTPSTLVKLKAEAAFVETGRVAETSLLNMVDSKVEMLDGVPLEWDTATADDEPIIILKDMGFFLMTMFQNEFSHLSYKMRTHLLMHAFEKVASYLKDSIFDARTITKQGLSNFKIDLDYMEELVSDMRKTSESDKDVNAFDKDGELEKDEKALGEVFVPLRQIVALLEEASLESYKDTSLRQNKYSAIKPDEAYQIVLKSEDYLAMQRRRRMDLRLSGSGRPAPKTSDGSSGGSNSSLSPPLADGEGKGWVSGLRRQASTANFSGFSLRKDR